MKTKHTPEIKRIFSTPGCNGEVLIKDKYGHKFKFRFTVSERYLTALLHGKDCRDDCTVWVKLESIWFILWSKIDSIDSPLRNTYNSLYIEQKFSYKNITVLWCQYPGQKEIEKDAA
jgi:hypothetical protein